MKQHETTKEIWKTIKDYPNYEISTLGNVRSKAVLLTPQWAGRGYKIVRLYKEGSRWKQFYVHRLLAEAFLPKDETRLWVDHIDRCFHNNTIDNLRWVNYHESALNRNKRTK